MTKHRPLPLLIVFILLGACSKQPVASRESSLHGEAAGRQELRTELLEEPEALEMLANIASSPAHLGSAEAERCWLREEARPSVREACLLLWSAGQEESEPLERTLLQEAVRSRIGAVAIVRRPNVTGKLSAPELLSSLTLLAKDPPWLRAMALRHWLDANPVSDLALATELWGALSLSAWPAELEPVSLRWVAAAAAKLPLQEAMKLRHAYCPPGVGGPAEVRCIRFLSAVDENDYPGQASSSGWAQFERSFPLRAKLTKKKIQ